DGAVAGQDFGLNFTLNESMQIGFRSVTDLLAADASLLNFGYFLSPQLGLDLMVGSDGTNIVGGADAFFYIFKSEGDDVFSSSLKMKAGYIFAENLGIENGVINAGLIGTVGY
ncbi:MAG: hypothetical protein ACOC2B_08115, partial [Sediminispirochaetaceae bacterium]